MHPKSQAMRAPHVGRTRIVDAGLCLALGIIVFLTQFGSLQIDELVTDEATFVLLGADWLDGNLPYTTLFDNKPPLIFGLVALAFALFGESLAVFRLMGDLFVWTSAILIFAIGKSYATKLPAFLGAALFVAISASRPGQFTNTEFPAVTFLLGATWLIMKRPKEVWAVFLAGVLISLATMTRTNLAVVAVGLTLAFGLSALMERDRWLHPLALPAALVGGALPALILIGIYWQAGALPNFWLGMITVPLNFATDQMTSTEIIARHWHYWSDYILRYPLMFGSYTLLIVAAAIYGLRDLAQSGTSLQARAPLLVFLFALLSMLISGTAYRHYWLQILPFANLLIIFLFQKTATPRFARDIGIALVAITLLSAARYNTPEALRAVFIPNWASSAQQVRLAAEFIRPFVTEDDRVWATQKHMILWYLDQRPMHPAIAHPENLTRREIIDPLIAANYAPPDLLDDILAQRPAFVVTGPSTPRYLVDEPTFQQVLIKDYGLFFELPLIKVYRRAGHGGWRPES